MVDFPSAEEPEAPSTSDTDRSGKPTRRGSKRLSVFLQQALPTGPGPPLASEAPGSPSMSEDPGAGPDAAAEPALDAAAEPALDVAPEPALDVAPEPLSRRPAPLGRLDAGSGPFLADPSSAAAFEGLDDILNQAEEDAHEDESDDLLACFEFVGPETPRIEVLIERAVMSESAARAALDDYHAESAPGDFGPYLVSRGLLTAAQLDTLNLGAPPPRRLSASERILSSQRTELELGDTDHDAPAPEPLTPAQATTEPTQPLSSSSGLQSANVSDRTLDDFRLEHKIGAGGMGEVYLATQISLDRKVAVKLLPPTLAQQPRFIERFAREARAAASLIHPNVIQVYAFGVVESQPYFAMEHVAGEDLHQRLQRAGRLELRETLRILEGVSSALAAAGDRDLVHRDIKPSNIMLGDSGVVKVMDFGLAKATSVATGDLTNAGVIMGTPNYMSPEQARGDTVDTRSDLYSLGVLFYELLAGALPFRADTPAGLMYKHVYEQPDPMRGYVEDVPPMLEEIVMRMLEKDPEDRYEDAHELLADLQDFGRLQDLLGESVLAPRAASGRRAKHGTPAPISPASAPPSSPGPLHGLETISDGELKPVRAALDGRAPGRLRASIAALIALPLLAAATALAGDWYGLWQLPLPGGARALLQRLWYDEDRPEPTPTRPEPLSAAPAGAAEVTSTAPVTQAPAKARFILNRLGPHALPNGVSVSWNGVDPKRATVLKEGQAYDLEPGRYQVTFHKVSYQDHRVEIQIDASGDARLADRAIKLDELALDFKPVAALAEAYLEAVAAQAKGRRGLAIAALERARALDERYRPRPDSPRVLELLTELEEAERADQVRLERRARGREAARKAEAGKDWRSALSVFRELSKERPSTSEASAAARRIERLLAELGLERDGALAALENGGVKAAALSLKRVIDRDPKDEVARAALRRTENAVSVLKDLDRHHERAREMLFERRYGEAEESFAAAVRESDRYLSALAPRDNARRAELSTLRSERARCARLAKLSATLERAEGNTDPAATIAAATALAQADPEHPRIAGVLNAARDRRARLAVAHSLAELDAAFLDGRGERLGAILDGQSDFGRRALSELAALAKRARFTRSQHDIQALERRGLMLVVSVSWGFSLKLDEPERVLEGTRPQLMTFRKDPGDAAASWQLVAVEATGP